MWSRLLISSELTYATRCWIVKRNPHLVENFLKLQIGAHRTRNGELTLLHDRNRLTL
jgi:hypothetical protein